MSDVDPTWSEPAKSQDVLPSAMGRKAWLLSDAPRVADVSAKLYSIAETAKACGLKPYAYLKLIFEKLPQ